MVRTGWGSGFFGRRIFLAHTQDTCRRVPSEMATVVLTGAMGKDTSDVDDEHDTKTDVSGWVRFLHRATHFGGLGAVISFEICSVIAIAELTRGNEAASSRLRALATCCVLQALAALVLVTQAAGLVREMRLRKLTPGPVVQMYISTTLSFAGVFFSSWMFDRKSLDAPQWGSHGHEPYRDAALCLYFSMATMTGTGFGDVRVTSPSTVTIASIQMLLATAYLVGAFAIALHQFASTKNRQSLRISRRRGPVSMCMKWLRTNVPGFERARRWLVRNLLLFSIVGTVAAVSTALWLDTDDLTGGRQKVKLAALLSIQLFEAIVVVMASFRLVLKIKTRDLSVGFLVQSFLSTLLLFFGAYLTLSLLRPESFHLPFSTQRSARGDRTKVWLWLLYFAVAAQTGTGYGDVYPLRIEAVLLVSVHIAIAFIYAAVILGLGIARVNSACAGPSDEQDGDARENTNTRCYSEMKSDGHVVE